MNPGTRRGCGDGDVRRYEQGRRPSRKGASRVLQPTRVTRGRSCLFGGLLHHSGQCVSITQVGQVALSANRAIWPLGRILPNVAAELRLGRGHVGVVCVVVFGQKDAAVLLEARKAAREWGL